MLTISYGTGKSGSSFAFQIISGILQARFANYDDFAADRSECLGDVEQNGLLHITTDEVEQLLARVPSTRMVAVKTHDVPDRAAFAQKRKPEISQTIVNAIAAESLRVICTIRHPLEMILSMLDHAERARVEGEVSHFAQLHTVEDAIPHVKADFAKAAAWSHYSALWLPYDDFVFEPKIAAHQIAKYMQLPLIDSSAVVDTLLASGKIHQFNVGKPGRIAEFPDDQRAKLEDHFSHEIGFYERIRKTKAW